MTNFKTKLYQEFDRQAADNKTILESHETKQGQKLSQLKVDYSNQIRILRDQLESYKQQILEGSEKYKQMSGSYQKQLGRFEEIITKNDAKIAEQT